MSVRESVCVCVCEWVSVCVCVCVTERERERECVCVCVCVCVSTWVSLFVVVSHVDKAWICSAEEFLELYGQVEAVVRNCLLRWSGHLFEVPSTHLFNQCFCFKHISLFCAPITAFFCLYYSTFHTCIWYIILYFIHTLSKVYYISYMHLEQYTIFLTHI